MNETIVVVINGLDNYELERKIQMRIKQKENENFSFHSSNINDYKDEYGRLRFTASLFFIKVEEKKEYNVKSF